MHFESCEDGGTGEEVSSGDLTVSGHFLLQNGGVHSIKLHSPNESTSLLDFLVVACGGNVYSPLCLARCLVDIYLLPLLNCVIICNIYIFFHNGGYSLLHRGYNRYW